jgi:hypothetical protein
MIGRVCITNRSRHMIIGSLACCKTNSLYHTHREPKSPFFPFDIFPILQSSYPHPSWQESTILLISTTSLPISEAWMDMFETNQLPKVKAYVLNGQIQASAVLHCIHFLVECAVTGHLVRFRPGPDRRKSRPWFWRRRQLASRHSPPHIRRCPKKTGHHHSSYAPFIPFSFGSKKARKVSLYRT